MRKSATPAKKAHGKPVHARAVNTPKAGKSQSRPRSKSMPEYLQWLKKNAPGIAAAVRANTKRLTGKEVL